MKKIKCSCSVRAKVLKVSHFVKSFMLHWVILFFQWALTAKSLTDSLYALNQYFFLGNLSIIFYIGYPTEGAVKLS